MQRLPISSDRKLAHVAGTRHGLIPRSSSITSMTRFRIALLASYFTIAAAMIAVVANVAGSHPPAQLIALDAVLIALPLAALAVGLAQALIARLRGGHLTLPASAPALVLGVTLLMMAPALGSIA
jgi:hypothetical protein